MKQHKPNQDQRMSPARKIVLALSTVGISMLFLAVSLLVTHSSMGNAHAASSIVSGTLSSSPSSGPVGATIAVSGSSWPESDGTVVDFGYLVGSTCNQVTDSQPGSIASGAFQGWFRWPVSTPPGTYTVCVLIGGGSANAGSYTVLSTTAPQVSISPNTFQERQQVTVTASNFYPAGTSVTFYWATTSNTVEFTLSTTTSANDGTAVMGFSVPITSLASGPYHVEAVGGGGQPAALFASNNFTYNAPVVPPSPTPKPSPNPSPSPAVSPTPAQNLSPTPTTSATPTVGATNTPAVTPTQSGTGTGTPTQVAGSTPTPGGSTLTTGNSNSTTSGKNSNDLLIAGLIGGLALLIAALTVMLLLRRRGKQKLAQASTSPPNGAAFPGVMMQQGPPGFYPIPGMMYPPNGISTPLPNTPPGFAYGQGGIQAAQVPPLPNSPAQPVPVLAGSAYMGVSGASSAGSVPSGQAPLPYRSLLKPVTPPPQVDPTALQGINGSTSLPYNPELDALRRQAQAGMFVQPRPGNMS